MIKLYKVWLDDGRLTPVGSVDDVRGILESWQLEQGIPELEPADLPTDVGASRIVYFPENAARIRKRAGLCTLAAVEMEPVYQFSIAIDGKPEHSLEGQGTAEEVEAAIREHEPAKGHHFILPNGTPSRRIHQLLKKGESARIVLGSGTSPADYQETAIGAVGLVAEK